MNIWAKKQTGFTIVELLIVVVVIAILAAITIVSYNGIQSRATASKNAAAAQQLVKKITVWNTAMGYYPTYAQLITNSTAPTMPASTWVAGGAAGPQEARVQGLTIATEYPDSTNVVSYVVCSTANTGYVLYYDPGSSNGVREIPINNPATLVYGYSPNCA